MTLTEVVSFGPAAKDDGATFEDAPSDEGDTLRTPPNDTAANAAIDDLRARLNASNLAQYTMADQLQRQQLILDRLLAGQAHQAHQNEMMLTQLHATVVTEQRVAEKVTLLHDKNDAATIENDTQVVAEEQGTADTVTAPQNGQTGSPAAFDRNTGSNKDTLRRG